MIQQDWLVTNDGYCIPQQVIESAPSPIEPYRLYRFLTDVEDILLENENNLELLAKICPLVRRLLYSSSWLQTNFLLPDPTTGWSVQILYDEPDFPLTIQTVAWSPGVVSPIHNHGTWGIVALIDGQEKNTFWQRQPTVKFADRIQITGTHILTPGDILCFMPDAIHQIQAMGTEPTISFNLYGQTNYQQRFEFDAIHHQAKLF